VNWRASSRAQRAAFETSPEHAKIETLFKLLSALSLELVLEPRRIAVG